MSELERPLPLERAPGGDEDVPPDSGRALRLNRRTFLGVLSAGLAGAPLGRIWPAVAGPFEAGEAGDHHVPADKKLTAEWVTGLFARGEPAWYGGSDLDTIGMPIGGICAGQVYLGGDGRLLYWDIFNRNLNTGYGALNYKPGRTPTEVVNVQNVFPALDLQQGFADRVDGFRRDAHPHARPPGIPQAPLPRRVPGRAGGVRRSGPAGSDCPRGILAVHSAEQRGLGAAGDVAALHRLEPVARTRCRSRWPGGWRTGSARRPRIGFAGRIERVNRVVSAPGVRGFIAEVRPRTDVPQETERDPLVFAEFDSGDYARLAGRRRSVRPSARPGHAAGAAAGQRIRRGRAGQHLPRRRPPHRTAGLPAVHDRAALHRLPHRRRQPRRPHLHQPGRRRPESSAPPPAATTSGCSRTTGTCGTSPARSPPRDRRRGVRRLGTHQHRPDRASATPPSAPSLRRSTQQPDYRHACAWP